MKSFFFFLSILLFLGLNAQNTNSNLVAITNSDPNQSVNDLQQTRSFFVDKKLIAFGESTHGTKEFFELKHRFFKYLADSLNHKILFMEAMYNSSTIVNDYILNGIGTQKEVMRAIGFDVYQTVEVWHLIEWMKEFNSTKILKDKVHFYGIDMQVILSGGLNLRRYVHSIDSLSINDFDTIAKPFYSDSLLKIFIRSGKNGVDAHTKIFKNQKIKALQDWFVLNRDKYIKNTNERDYNLITYQINTIAQTFDFYTKLNEGYRGISNFRDSCMANNLKFVLDNYETTTKAMLWAHNAHVTKKLIYKTKPLGFYLNNIYHDGYYAVGFIFNEGTFRALRGPKNLLSGVLKLVFTPKKVYSKSFENITVKPLTKNALAQKMETYKLPYFFLNLDDKLTSNPDFKWINEPLEFYELGATFTFLHTNKLALLSAYEGVIYVQKTSAAVPLN